MENVCQIKLSEQARRAYEQMFGAAQTCMDNKQVADGRIALFRLVDDLIYSTIPKQPFNSQWVLPGNFSNIYRIMKSGICVVYTISPESSQVTILYILQKTGRDCHSCDPYSSLQKIINSGKGDLFLKMIGINAPAWSKPAQTITNKTGTYQSY